MLVVRPVDHPFQMTANALISGKTDDWWKRFREHVDDYRSNTFSARAEFRVEPWAVKHCLRLLASRYNRFFESESLATAQTDKVADILLIHARVSLMT